MPYYRLGPREPLLYPPGILGGPVRLPGHPLPFHETPAPRHEDTPPRPPASGEAGLLCLAI